MKLCFMCEVTKYIVWNYLQAVCEKTESSSPRHIIMYMQVFQSSNIIWNSKHCWSQAYQEVVLRLSRYLTSTYWVLLLFNTLISSGIISVTQVKIEMCIFVFLWVRGVVGGGQRVLEIEPKALCMPGKCSTTEPNPQTSLLFCFL